MELEKHMFRKLKACTVYKYLKQLIFRYHDGELAAMSAQITYYLILAFFPFLFFVINLLSFTPLSNKLLIANFNAILPNDAANLVKNILVETVQDKSGILLILGMIGSLWAASRGMAAIIRGLNNSYGVRESRSFIKIIFISLTSTAGLTGMIILSLFMIVFGRMIGAYVFELMGGKVLFYSIWSFIRGIISFTAMFVTFYFMYRYLPNRKYKFHDLVVGAMFATFGWVSVSLVFSYFVNHFAIYEKVYGSLGGIFALIIWLYMSTLIFLLGGELNAISRHFEDREEQ